MKPNIGIADKDRQAVAEILNTLLSDEYVLYTKTRNFHWNVTGLQFNDLHKFFEAQYEELDDIVDEVAERARSLGARAFGTLEEFRENTRLKETPGTVPPAKEMLAELLLRSRDPHPGAPSGPREGRQAWRRRHQRLPDRTAREAREGQLDAEVVPGLIPTGAGAGARRPGAL